MKTLYLLRHAKAVPGDAEGDDRARPLAERGDRASRAVGQWLADRRATPALVLCSSTVRTRQTLALVLPALTPAPQVLYEDGLYLADARVLLARLREVGAGTASLLLVGHNPGIQELAALLAEPTTGRLARRLAEGMPTGALVAFEVPGNWSALDRHRARLVDIVTPKELARGRP
jgi:phosphohistidine phosphatase